MNRPIVVNDGGSTTKKTTTTTTNTFVPGTPIFENAKTPDVIVNKTTDVVKQNNSAAKELDEIKNQAIKDAQKETFISSAPNNKNSSGVPVSTTTVSSGSGSSSSSGTKKSSNTSSNTSKTSFSNIVSGLSGNQNQVQTPPVQIVPDTTVEDSYRASMNAANERLKQAYEYQQGLLSKAKDDALREAYVKQQMVQRAYPEQLSAAGINGGAAQALIARNNADYANQRGSIQGDYLNNLGEAGQSYQQGVLQNNQIFLENMAAYRQALDNMRRQWELQQLSKSGLLDVEKGSRGFYGTPQITPQEYLNNLRANYGNLFK